MQRKRTRRLPVAPILAIPLLAAGLAVDTAAAQVPHAPRALGMGGAAVATARGQEALFSNPANLGLPGTPYWSVAMGLVGIGGTLVGPEVSDLWDLVKASKQEQERRDEILVKIPETGMEIDMEFRVPAIAFQSGRFALGMSYGALIDHGFGRDLVELFINGYDPSRTDYGAGNTRGSRATYLDFAAGYGRQVGPVSVGATAHYIRGRTLSRSRLFEPRIDAEAGTIEVEYREVLARGGTGYALDLGIAAQPVPHLTVSATLANALARMTWTDELTTRSMLITQDDFGASSRHWEAILHRFEHGEQPVDPHAAPHSVHQTAEGLYDSAFFPARLRAGASYALPQTGTQVEAAFQRTLSSGRLAGGWEHSIAVGAQQLFTSYLGVRAGAATDLDGRSLVSVGARLAAFDIGLGRTRAAADVEGPARTGWVASVGLNTRTTTSMP